MVVKCITWSHEVQYTTAGKPVAYEDFTVSSFVQGHLIIMKSEDSATREKMTQHLTECIGDIDLIMGYGSTGLSRAGTDGMMLMTS